MQVTGTGPKLPPNFRNYLINTYIGGKKLYYMNCVEVRYQLMKEALERFNQDMIRKHGSRKNYNEWFAKTLGFKDYKEYRRELVRANGFEGYNDYNNFLAKKHGFKNQYDKNKKRIKNLGFKTFYEYYKYLAKKKDLKNPYEYAGRKAIETEKECPLCEKTFSSLGYNKFCTTRCSSTFHSRLWRKRHPDKMKALNRKHYLLSKNKEEEKSK